MRHSTLTPAERDIDLGRLDEMIAALKPSPEAELLIEHLHSARTYLLGAMPEEYFGSLEAARRTLHALPASGLRRDVDETLGKLRSEMDQHEGARANQPAHHRHTRSHDPAPAGASSTLWRFFNISDTSFGVFYPKGFIIAAFPSFEAARNAEAALRGAGFSSEEVIAAPGAEVLQFYEDLQLQSGLWGRVMDTLSRTFATEAVFVERDRDRARDGAGFLAVYDPFETESSRIRDLITPFGPLAVRRYDSGGIVALI